MNDDQLKQVISSLIKAYRKIKYFTIFYSVICGFLACQLLIIVGLKLIFVPIVGSIITVFTFYVLDQTIDFLAFRKEKNNVNSSNDDWTDCS